MPWFDEYEVKLGKPLDPPQTKPWRDGIYRRRFENGLVLVNLGFQPGSIDVEPGYTHFRGKTGATGQQWSSGKVDTPWAGRWGAAG
ncbi:hypothetical protein ACFS07_02465 [Undibacterium arcticum]